MKPLFAAVLAATACGGSEVRGGALLPVGTRLPGPTAPSYRSVRCADARGRPAVPPETRIRVVETKGSVQLFEIRAGYPTIVVRNRFETGAESVFQVVLDTDAAELVREYRLDRASRTGTLRVLDVWEEIETETDAGEGRFRAHGNRAALVCALELVRPG
jgi:hypothetical protein